MLASSLCFPDQRQETVQEQISRCGFVPKSFGERIFLLVVSEDSVRVHRGERTGLPVAFSRMSDALRLCRVRNGDAEVPYCVLNTAEVELLLIEAAEELNEEINRRMHRKEHGKSGRRQKTHG